MHISPAAIFFFPAILVLCSGAASADMQKLFSKAKPPVGFVEFCKRNHDECLPARSADKLVLTKERWKNLHDVNGSVNSKIRPKTDQQLYGVPERWDYPINAGDCEDFALLKKRYLQYLGFMSGPLSLAIALDETGEAHAVLMVLTDQGDFVLDNRRNEILPWNQTRYHFLQRQSVEDPLTWVALSRTGVMGSVGAHQAKRRNR